MMENTGPKVEALVKLLCKKKIKSTSTSPLGDSLDIPGERSELYLFEQKQEFVSTRGGDYWQIQV